MEKIDRFKKSLERLMKVWKSKIEFEEEKLILEDMKWLSKVYDILFEEENIDQFVNIYGQYNKSLIEDFDFSSFLEDSNIKIENEENEEFKFQKEKISRKDYDKFYYDSITENYLKFNAVDIIPTLLKNLTLFVEKKRLVRLSSIILLTYRKIYSKIMLFEREVQPERFDSEKLFKQFIYKNLNELFNSYEIENRIPSLTFLTLSIYGNLLYEYYNNLFAISKVKIARGYLLSVWWKLKTDQDEELMNDFLNTLSGKSINNRIYYKADIHDIQRRLKREDRESTYISELKSLKDLRKKIIDEEDLKTTLEKAEKILNLDRPKEIPGYIINYFIETEKENAVILLKYREIQLLVFEILALTLHHYSNDRFYDIFKIFKNPEQYSNLSSFFPKDYHDLLTWIQLVRRLENEIYLRFFSEGVSQYFYEILNFLIIQSLPKKINFDAFKRSVEDYGLRNNSVSLNSIKNFAQKIKVSDSKKLIFTPVEKEDLFSFWTQIENISDEEIIQSETEQEISKNEKESFISSVLEHYKSKSLIYKLAPKFSQPLKKRQGIFSSFISVQQSHLILRRHLISNWFIPVYGLQENLAQEIVQDELIQVEYKIFNKHISSNKNFVKRNQINNILKNLKSQYIILFRNAFPDYWIRNSSFNFSYNKNKSNSGNIDEHEWVYYKTSDSKPELLLIPIGDMSIKYVLNLNLLEDRSFPVKLHDLSTDLEERNKMQEQEILGSRGENIELRKYLIFKCQFQIRIKINDDNNIQRIPLDPHGD